MKGKKQAMTHSVYKLHKNGGKKLLLSDFSNTIASGNTSYFCSSVIGQDALHDAICDPLILGNNRSHC